jgi:O-succinylbenzoic acid--CoA ligase
LAVSTLSIFDAAREQPHAIALVEGARSLTFAEAAQLAAPRAAALLAAPPRVLGLVPRADLDSLLWLYAAWATNTPVLTLHPRATATEHQAMIALCQASPPPPGSKALPRPLALKAPRDSDPLVYIPTSGSTGVPRLVELSRGALLASARASEQNLGWLPEDRWLLCLPLAHAGGLSIVARTLLARKTTLLFEPGNEGALARARELAALAEQATLPSLVPSLLQALLDAGLRGGGSLRAIVLGGAACSPALARRAHAAGLPLLTSYGLTETASQVVTRRYAERFDPLPEAGGCVSSGHPLPDVDLELREGGVIALRSPALLTRYHDAAPSLIEQRAASGLDRRGFFITSDRGELGAAGELYVRGRVDDLLVTAGENVDPLEVEAALLELPGIVAACVFGTPSTQFGQIVSAVLVSHDTALGEPETLARLLADRLSRHKLPRRSLLAETLPLTPSGKVDRRACAARYSEQLLGTAPAGHERSSKQEDGKNGR